MASRGRAIAPARPAARNERRGRKGESSFMSKQYTALGFGQQAGRLVKRDQPRPARSSRRASTCCLLLGEFSVENRSAHLGHDRRNLDRLARLFCDPEGYFF